LLTKGQSQANSEKNSTDQACNSKAIEKILPIPDNAAQTIEKNANQDKITEVNMMKFPRPKVLLDNMYPDLTLSQPEMLRSLVQETVKPAPNTPMDQYVQASVNYLKNQARQKNMIKVNQCIVGDRLFFAPIKLNESEEVVACLVDTGATNSLLHVSIAKKLKLKIQPVNLKLSTCTGVSDTAIKGIAHVFFHLINNKNEKITFCTSIIVTEALNGLQAILGAEFLLDKKRVHSLNGSFIKVYGEHKIERIPIYQGQTGPQFQSNQAIEPNSDINEPKVKQDSEKSTEVEEPTDESKSATENDCNCKLSKHNQHLDQGSTISFNSSYSVKQDIVNETLPPSTELFEDNLELDHKLLDKKFTIYDGDFSQCPKEYKSKLETLLLDYQDRFSKSKLDLETTELYTAALPTKPNKKVCQPVRRLPYNKFKFAMKAIKQLEQAGVVRPSDSSWRSNVVMVPKPTSTGELRQNTKADQLTGQQHHAELYRVCLDFRQLNDILDFPQQTQFTTIDDFLQTLKNKVVVSLDISSSFFIIPIEEEDRHKTSFWINEHAFEFCSLVMGLKSSPYHLNKFLEKAFSAEAYEICIKELTEEEKALIPPNFAEFIKNYFDDFFVYADNYDILFACLKLVLIAARRAKIKFSIEKTTFFATNIKILGYSFDTKNIALAMDHLKASALINMKKPSSLYELHSRLAAFQYQSHFLPYIKDVLYPLHFLLRKKQFSWGPIEERAWQQAKMLVSLSLKLTIPDPEDELVLTTDASKLAASACLFRVKNNQLQLVSLSSKYFSTADLNKNSYTLEAISLAYALKVFAPYLLNCQATVKIFTDARSLIYAKRMSTHSILLNNTLNYLTNFVSLLNVELYHIPGNVNVLADVLSRAVADNLNCSLPREHPLSKTWAAQLPAIPNDFAVTHQVLYEFLTKPLKAEPQDIYDRAHRKLMEPRTLQQAYDYSKKITPEQQYYSAIALLEQWNSRYASQHASQHANSAEILSASGKLDLEKQRVCLEKIQEIMDKVYEDIKNTPLYKQIHKNLVDASKRFLTAAENPQSADKMQKLQRATQEVLHSLALLVDRTEVEQAIQEQIKKDYIKTIETLTVESPISDSPQPIVSYNLHPEAKFKPKICEESNGIDLPFQESVTLQPNELKKVNLKVQFKLPKHHCALLMNKSSARLKYNIAVTLGLIDIGFTNFLQVVIQNMSNEKMTLPAGTAVAQLLVLPSQVPTLDNSWSVIEQSRGSFGSTGQDFESIEPSEPTEQTIADIASVQSVYLVDASAYHPLADIVNKLNPQVCQVENFSVNLLGNEIANSQTAFMLEAFQAEILAEADQFNQLTMPQLPSALANCQTSTLPDKLDEQLSQSNPYLTDETLATLLAADLADNRKLTMESLIYFQSTDPLIAEIKESLQGTSELHSFILKKNVVCKVFQQESASPKVVVYLPTALLLPTIIYIHRHFLHPSKTQTFKEFANLYYHPHARKHIARVCQACITCSIARNADVKDTPIGRERSLKPSAPREMISIDILYMPQSSQGHSHALLIADLFSLYLTFFPLKSKSSAQVASALRSYISMQGVPKVVYSDNDQAFLGEVQDLLTSYNIQHSTSFPYTQKENTVEAQVRRFKNAYRGALLNNPVFSHRQWHLLYPLVIVRLNTMISKYGLSREMAHFKEVLDTHIPVITDTEYSDELKADFDKMSYDFRSKIKKFLRNKEKSKARYKTGKKYNFFLHELVMRKVYNPSSLLHPVFTGPYRIMEIFELGALLKDPKTGETCSVHFQNLRKLSVDEFATLLPANFDHDIIQQLSLSRYNRSGQSETLPQKVTEKISGPDFEAKHTEEQQHDVMKLRSGKIVKLHATQVPAIDGHLVQSAIFTSGPALPRPAKPILAPVLKKKLRPAPTAYATFDQYFSDGIWIFASSFSTSRLRACPCSETKYRSSFQSPTPGTLRIDLAQEDSDNDRKIKFKRITVYFY